MSRALFTPISFGSTTTPHRIAMAPLTRFRASDTHTQGPLNTCYYGQRAMEGGLIITEATFIAPEAGGYPNVPGIYSHMQIRAWQEIVEAVQSKGAKLFLQMWAIGRAASGPFLNGEGYDIVSSSNIGLDPNGPTRGTSVPRPLTIDEIKDYARMYAKAAKTFISIGGSGVEVHAANGYLIDQFTQSTCNTRTDIYGGSIENRCRFGMEVLAAVVDAVGADKVGIRMSPHSEFQGMKMPKQEMIDTFSYFVASIKHHHPDLAYLHVTEPRVGGGNDQASEESENIDFIHTIWAPKTIIVAGGYTPASAIAEAEKRPNAMIGIGRAFISNPDLVTRIKNGIPLTPYDRTTFYSKGPKGYTDWKTAAEAGLESKL